MHSRQHELRVRGDRGREAGRDTERHCERVRETASARENGDRAAQRRFALDAVRRGVTGMSDEDILSDDAFDSDDEKLYLLHPMILLSADQ